MSDLASFSLNLAVAMALGMAIGLERQLRQHTAGLRTNALVCVGAAMFVSLSGLMNDTNSRTRMASYVISGIGFLGGGVILREGLNVRGMNTAATLWCSAAVGSLVGSGFIGEGIVGAGAVLFMHTVMRPMVRVLEERAKTVGSDIETLYHVKVVCAAEQEGLIHGVLMRHINSVPQMSVQGIKTTTNEDCHEKTVVAEIFSSNRNDRCMNDLVARISIEPCVTSISWERTR